jgi:glycogen(starch) synthase
VVVAPSGAMANAVADHYRVGGCRVIPNGRCPSRFRRAVKEPFVLTAGRVWDEAKNAGAVAAVADRIGWPVYVAGEARRELAGCTMLGWLRGDELANWYSRAAIYALPARYEPFGLSALEAAHSGCALVLGDIPSLREIWGDAASFVPPEDSLALEHTLRELIANPARRQAMADAAYEHAMQYTPRRMGDRYMEAYASVADRRRACAS